MLLPLHNKLVIQGQQQQLLQDPCPVQEQQRHTVMHTANNP